MKCIIAKKIEMTQLFNADGTVVPVTLVTAGECDVLQIKTKDKDGYEAIKIGFEKLPEKKIKKSGTPFRYLKEFRGIDINSFKVGDKISASLFEPGDIIKVSGTSKGKGFQGGVKRWRIFRKTFFNSWQQARAQNYRFCRFCYSAQSIERQKDAGKNGQRQNLC